MMSVYDAANLLAKNELIYKPSNMDVMINSIIKDACNSVYGAPKYQRFYDLPDGNFIKKVIFNDRATIVIFFDGTKTIVKRADNDPEDKEKAILACIAKKVLGQGAMRKIYKLSSEARKQEYRHYLKKADKIAKKKEKQEENDGK